MQNHFKFIFMMVIILSSLQSCNKDNDATPEEDIIRKILVASSANSATTYEYHLSGNIALESSLGSTIEYNYAVDEIIHTWTSNGNSNTATCELDSDGKAKIINDLNQTNYREYDNDGHLIKSIQYNDLEYIRTITHSFSNGNLISTTIENASGNTDKRVHTYFDTQKNTLGNEYFGKSFLGKNSKNPIKKTTMYYGSEVYTIDYSYEYDDEGYIENKKSDWSKNGVFQSTSTTSYIYE